MNTEKENNEKIRKEKLFQQIQDNISKAMKELNTINNDMLEKKKRPRIQKNDNSKFEKI